MLGRTSAGQACARASECNNAGDRLTLYPQRAAQIRQCGATVHDKDYGHFFRLRHALIYLGDSQNAKVS